MIVWDILNSLFRLIVTGILIYKLVCFPILFNGWERRGMAVMAGCSLLTVTVIWEGERSPFDGWATSLFTFGLLLYLIGRLTRHPRHQAANEMQIAKGKLR